MDPEYTIGEHVGVLFNIDYYLINIWAESLVIDSPDWPVNLRPMLEQY